MESTVLGIGFAWELGYTIAVPAVLFGFGGGYIDKHYIGGGHLFLFMGIILAFVSSFIVIWKKIKAILDRMPKIQPKKRIEPEISKEQEALHDLFRPPSE